MSIHWVANANALSTSDFTVRLKNMKKVIIIGATSGIGKELARLYSLNKYEVGLVGRRSELLEALVSELQTKSYKLTLDIKETENTINSIEKLIQDMHGVDLIIISAGTGHLNDDLDWSKEKETIDTNVLGFSAIANIAMRYFMKKRAGHLVGISSIASIRGSSIAPAYNASKAFMSNYLEGLRIKTSKKHIPIIITDIQPGLVDTAMAKGDGLFWVAPPKKAAKQIYKAIKNKKKKAYITKRWAIIASLLKIMPDCIYKKL